MLAPDQLFITDYTELVVDLYRNGNASHARLNHVREGFDVEIYEVNGVKRIRANGNGISAFTTYDASKKHWYRLAKGTPLPARIRLVKDTRKGFENHYMLAPGVDMLLAEYIGLLDTLRERCIKVS